MDYYRFIQFLFFYEWNKLKAYANDNGISIVGDIPIFMAWDSVDVWANQKLFLLDKDGYPTVVAGVPPDYLSATGQLWGNPLYNWDYHRQTGYEWWVRRMKHAKKLYDVVRIDHFRGFDEYFSIPAKDDTAINGRWEKGPGMDLFNTLKREIPDVEVIAEDLGVVTPSVEKLVADSGFPNMRVLRWQIKTGILNLAVMN